MQVTGGDTGYDAVVTDFTTWSAAGWDGVFGATAGVVPPNADAPWVAADYDANHTPRLWWE
jgi:hypothetical protein